MYQPVTFNNTNVTRCPRQKHLSVVLDSKPDFKIHIEQKIKKRKSLSQEKLHSPLQIFCQASSRLR